MRNRILGVLAVMFAAALTASAQTTTTDPVQALKDTLGNGQQGGLLQDIIGQGQNNDKKTDKKLESPQSVQPVPNEKDIIEKDIKTRDGRTLRQFNEDPELRADDSVTIELRPVDDVCVRYNLGPEALQNLANNQNNLPGGPIAAPGVSPDNPLGALTAAAGAASAAGANPLTGLSGTNSIGGISGTNQNQNIPNTTASNNWFDLTRCPLSTEKLKTDDEKSEEHRFEQRILDGNPYKLNKFGVLELPGLPAMPLSGMTASEATKRLATDPDLSDYFVRLSLLRLTAFDEEALKPFGYDLFEGVPSTFAPVSDIQVPADYLIGPGDTLVVQLYGNEPRTYELTVERDGRINFPKLGPIVVSGMTFEHARATIEEQVERQLIGTHVSVTMGALRSIRVFVLGDAEKPGSYTVSGLSTMTNALFVSGGVKKIGSLRNIQLKRDGRLITTLDLYDLLLHGDTSGDRQLLPGDVIFIPPIGTTVAVYGAVRRPAIYELKTESTVAQVIDLAGGLLPDADASLGQLERILPSQLRRMLNVDLTAAAGRLDGTRQRRQVANPLDQADSRELGQAFGICVSARCVCLSIGPAADGCAAQFRRSQTRSGSALHHDSPRSAAGAQDRSHFRRPDARVGRASFRG